MQSWSLICENRKSPGFPSCRRRQAWAGICKTIMSLFERDVFCSHVRTPKYIERNLNLTFKNWFWNTADVHILNFQFTLFHANVFLITQTMLGVIWKHSYGVYHECERDVIIDHNVFSHIYNARKHIFSINK